MAEEDDPFAHTRMSLSQHLEELRKRLIRGVFAVFIAFCFCWEANETISHWMLWPLTQSVEWLNRDQAEAAEAFLKAHPDHARSEFFVSDDPNDHRLKNPIDPKPQALDISETFFFGFRNAMYAAIALGGPVLLWQMWGFIAAGLYQKERKLVMSYFPLSLFLFACGLASAFFALVPYGIYYLQKTLPQDLAAFKPALGPYMEFLSNTALWTGVTFQMPIVMQVLIRIDLIEAKTFAKFRRHFIVASFLISGIITPSADPYSQTLLAIPMWGLYELGIAMGRYSVWRAKKRAEAEAKP